MNDKMKNKISDDMKYDDESEKIPTKKEAINLLHKLKLQKHIINHVLAVSRVATDLADRIRKKGIKVDLNLVKIGAILHDIGRTQSHGFQHAKDGGKIIRELGYSEKLARIAECHILGGMTRDEAKEMGLISDLDGVSKDSQNEKDFLPKTLEEKIVCYADKLISGDKRVTIDERFSNWIERFGETPLLLNGLKRTHELEDEIHHLIFD